LRCKLTCRPSTRAKLSTIYPVRTRDAPPTPNPSPPLRYASWGEGNPSAVLSSRTKRATLHNGFMLALNVLVSQRAGSPLARGRTERIVLWSLPPVYARAAVGLVRACVRQEHVAQRAHLGRERALAPHQHGECAVEAARQSMKTQEPRLRKGGEHH